MNPKIAISTRIGADRFPDAAADPAATIARAAGKGTPIASANTAMKIKIYPWCASSEKTLFIEKN
ncbi:MAG: hypothetical protein NVSMB58_00760 [Terriglobales bacterium]